MAAGRPLAAGAALLLLALDASGRRPSAALLRGEELLAEEIGAPGRSGAESLLPCVDAALRRSGVTLDQVGAFAVSVGPGSFTGLRVAVTTVKGLAFGTARPVAAVPSLAALARRAPPEERHVAALLDARRGELYAAAYRLEGEARRPVPIEPGEAVRTPEELAALLPASCCLVGEGVAVAGERIRALAGPGIRLGPDEDPRASDVARLGRWLLEAGAGIAAADLAPRYLRRAQAEARRTGERFE